MIFRYNLAAALFVWVGVLSSQVSNTVCFAPQTVGRDPRRLARIRHTSSAARFPPTGRSQPSQPIGRSSAPLAGFGFGEGVTKAASSGLDSATSSPLFEYFMQTIISNGVPAFFTVVTFFFVAKFFRGSKDDSFREETAISELYEDLYGSQKKKGSMGGLSFGSRSPKSSRNLGIPSEQYIKVRNWNQKLDSYRFSMDSATKSKAAAAARYREKSFDRALQQGLGSLSTLSPHVKTSLLRAEEIFLREASLLVAELQSCQAKLAGQAIAREMKRMGSDITDMDPSPSSNITNSTTKNETGSFSFFGKSNSMKELNKIQGELTQLELDFVREVVRIVGPESAAGVRAALMGDYAGRGIGGLLTQLQERPLSVMLEGAADHGTTKKSLFVARFRGDVQASQVNNLREEVTAIIQSSKPGDEALVVLQTGGGTVTGYGLAAAQLLRIKEHGLKLTIAVEQVAASGGYMMCCVADRIIASPFAVLGSIGVITDIPNVYERLKKEGIEFQTVTAGKFKRTLTPTKKVTPEDFKKTKEDVEGILELFSGFVKENRPQLDIDKVATGETWFGSDAVEKGLCDELKTVDEAMTEFADMGYNVFEISYSPPIEDNLGLSRLLPAESADENGSVVRKAIRWFVRTIASEVRAELGSGLDRGFTSEQRYMMQDDIAERTKASDRYY